MKLQKAWELAKPLTESVDIMEDHGDAAFLAYFSKEEDKYQACSYGMDAGDAILIIQGLIKKFDLDLEVLFNSLIEDLDEVQIEDLDVEIN